MNRLILTPLFVLIFAGLSFSQATVANCPTIVVEGPSGVTPIGKQMKFTANINAVNPKLTFEWAVERGVITDGQGSNAISVVGNEPGTTVTVSVKIGGLPDGCKDTAAESAPIDLGIVCGLPFAEWVERKPNEIRGELDMFFTTLANNPEEKGLVVIRVVKNETLEPSNKRIQFIVKHAKFREFDLNRLTFRIARADENRTTLNRYQPGVELPCPECIEYLGSSL